MHAKKIALIVTLLLLAVAPSLHASCSATSLAGRFGFTTTGTVIVPNVGPAPVGAVGIVIFDANGNLVGKQTRSLGGQVADETFSGVYTVNADCTANFTVKVFIGSILVRTSTVNFVINDNGQELRAVFTSSVLPNNTPLPSILTAEAKRLFPSDDD